MQAEQTTLTRAADGSHLLPSAQKTADGVPRFTIALPAGYESDPGLALLAKLEARHAGFEFATRAFFERHLAPGDIFLDVGAHLGLYGMMAATRLPGQVRVVAFEPHPLNALTLLRQLGLNGLQGAVDLVTCAIGAEAGFGKLWPFSTMGNFLSDARPEAAFADNPPLHVPVMPLDLFMARRPDLASGRIMLKVDVEGFEPEAIAGADRLLASGRVAAVALEKSDFYAPPDRWQRFEGMVARLEAHGYRIRWFPHLHLPCALIPWVPGNETGNLLAIAPDLAVEPVYDGPYAPYAAPPPPMSMAVSPGDRRALTERLIRHRATDGYRWAVPANMEDGAEERAALAAPHIPARSRILDLGAGLMKIAAHLRMGSRYTPVDLVRYASSTVLADLNDGRFPEGQWDCALALALFEHVHDVPALLARIRLAAKRLICVYECVEEVGDIALRRERGYFNDLDRPALQAKLQAAGFRPVVVEIHGRFSLFVCD